MGQNNALVLLGRLKFSVDCDYTPLSDAQLKAHRDIRKRIEAYLEGKRAEINTILARRSREEISKDFEINRELGEGVLERAKVATTIRTWLVREFRGKVGLSCYETTFYGSRIRLDF